MTALPIRNDYHALLTTDTPMIDLRAPTEYLKGSVPHATSLPLMSDDERTRVGTCYKQQGQEAAIALGHALVSGAVKATRLDAWRAFAERHPDAVLFCWRGGLRSQTTQAWLAEQGCIIPRVEGGYKALRRFLIDQLTSLCARAPFTLIAGKTGCRKTQLINALKPSVDLEGLANHRGSSFGRRPQGQPTQLAFENRLAVALVKASTAHPGPLFLEDEGGFIGGVSLPHELYTAMSHSPIAIIEMSLDQRVDTVQQDYVVDLCEEYLRLDPTNGFERYAEAMLAGMQRLKKRMGSEACMDLSKKLSQALAAQQRGDIAPHRAWITPLLSDYYDPKYNYHLARNQRQIAFKGSYDEVLSWCLRQSEQ